MTVRMIQWGAGRNGQALIRAVAGHADLEVRLEPDAQGQTFQGEGMVGAAIGVIPEIVAPRRASSIRTSSPGTRSASEAGPTCLPPAD